MLNGCVGDLCLKLEVLTPFRQIRPLLSKLMCVLVNTVISRILKFILWFRIAVGQWK
jgi:hypothetical protein